MGMSALWCGDGDMAVVELASLAYAAYLAWYWRI
jgi:hypothetical protein